MAKLNEVLKVKLVFNKKEIEGDTEFPGCKQVIIYTEYHGIYRQFSFHVGANAHHEEDVENLLEEAKNLLTSVIDKELSKKYVRCRSCSQHLIQDFKESTMHKCENCGEMNDIKVLIEKHDT